MMAEEIITNKCNVANCKYYVEDNGVKHQDLYQYTDMCYKEPYDYCENKPFCWHKTIERVKGVLKWILK